MEKEFPNANVENASIHVECTAIFCAFARAGAQSKDSKAKSTKSAEREADDWKPDMRCGSRLQVADVYLIGL